jgi:hypothetical protein
MRKRLLQALALVVAFLAGSVVTTRVHADGQKTFTAPVEWGQFRGANNDYLIFEDGRGVIRLASINAGMQYLVEVQRVQTKR